MNRTFVGAAMVTLAVFGVATGDEFIAILTKVENGRVTFVRAKFNKENKKFEKGEPVTLPPATNIKVGRARFNKDTKKTEIGDPIEGGLKNELFNTLGPNGMPVRIITDDDNRRVLAIVVTGKKKSSK